MALYQLTTGTAIIRTLDGALIPAISTNPDYQKYLAWIAAGNTPDAALTLAQTQQQQLALINQTAQAAYSTGFTSAATGAPLWYDSDLDSQRVIDRQYLIALNSPATYNALSFANSPVGTTPIRAKTSQTDADSAKSVQYITQSQMIILGQDMAAAWAAVKAKLWQKQAQVYNAKTIADVQAVTW